MPCKGIYKRAVVIPVARMYHKTCRFVHYKHIAVFINYVERNILCDYLELVTRTVHYDLNHIERFYAVVALYGFAVDKDAAGFGSLLHAVARRFLKARDKKFVDAQQFLTLVGDKTEMFEVLDSAYFHYFALGRAFVFKKFFVGHYSSLSSVIMYDVGPSS